MLSGNTKLTILTKFIILLANFGLVVFTTRIWGSDGRGEIALVIANVSIITIFSNIFCGSTIAYHTPRIQRNMLLGLSLAGALVISFSGALIFSLLFGFRYFLPLYLIAFLLSLTTSASSHWLGSNKIKHYNLISLLNPLLILTFLLVFYSVFGITSLNVVYLAYYSGICIALIVSIIILARQESFKMPELSFPAAKSVLKYGINNEFNYLIQFLSYRISYYFIAALMGIAELGVFSVAIAVSEAVWIISRSMSAIHFANVINSADRIKMRHETVSLAKQSLLISSMIMIIPILLPEQVYRFVFGEEFGSVRILILYLFPGIVAISASNLFGHYFAGTGKLKILTKKSLIGLVSTIILLPLLIKKYQLAGVCISLNISYILSSLYLWLKFRKDKDHKGYDKVKQRHTGD